MAPKFYLGSDFLYPQENRAFKDLCRSASEYMAEKDGLRVIGSVECNGYPMDCLVLSRRSITVVDFKDYGGEVRASEDAPWYADGDVEVKGGSYLNPFKQVQAYKHGVIKWLETKSLLSDSNDLGHISGLVMFTKSVSVDDSSMSPRSPTH